MKLIYASAAALTLALTGAATAQPQATPGWLALPQHSVASTDDALSILVNPAGLGVEGDGSWYFLAPYQGSAHFEDWGFVAGDGLGFAMEAFRHDPAGSRRRYTWGIGFGDNGTYAGFSYSWTTGIDRQNTWEFGVLERPVNWLSLGAVVRNANQPRLAGVKLPVQWDLGMAFRPLAAMGWNADQGGDRVTLTVDASLRGLDEFPNQEKQSYFEEIDWKIGASGEVLPGLTANVEFSPEVSGALAHSSRISGGLTFKFWKVTSGLHQTSGKGEGVAFISTQERFHRTLFKRK